MAGEAGEIVSPEVRVKLHDANLFCSGGEGLFDQDAEDGFLVADAIDFAPQHRGVANKPAQDGSECLDIPQLECRRSDFLRQDLHVDLWACGLQDRLSARRHNSKLFGYIVTFGKVVGHTIYGSCLSPVPPGLGAASEPLSEASVESLQSLRLRANRWRLRDQLPCSQELHPWLFETGSTAQQRRLARCGRHTQCHPSCRRIHPPRHPSPPIQYLQDRSEAPTRRGRGR